MFCPTIKTEVLLIVMKHLVHILFSRRKCSKHFKNSNNILYLKPVVSNFCLRFLLKSNHLRECVCFPPICFFLDTLEIHLNTIRLLFANKRQFFFTISLHID